MPLYFLLSSKQLSLILALPNMICMAFLQKLLGKILLPWKFTTDNSWLNVHLKTPYRGLFMKEGCELQIIS